MGCACSAASAGAGAGADLASPAPARDALVPAPASYSPLRRDLALLAGDACNEFDASPELYRLETGGSAAIVLYVLNCPGSSCSSSLLALSSTDCVESAGAMGVPEGSVGGRTASYSFSLRRSRAAPKVSCSAERNNESSPSPPGSSPFPPSPPPPPPLPPRPP